MKFEIISKFKPSGDQPRAIKELVRGLEQGNKHQTLLGVTGSGKTFTTASVIEHIQKPTLVIAHNKTLAAQLCNEFRELFPNNSVHYFVSYYDYYQPEAYIPTSDTYIEKEAMINDEIDKLRHAATTSLLTRPDVIIVASVSCIYGLGAPETYKQNIFHLAEGNTIDRAGFTKKLVDLQYTRTTADLTRGTFRLRGDNWEIMPPNEEIIYNLLVERIEGQTGIIREIYKIDPVRGYEPGKTPRVPEVIVPPAKHFITPEPERERAIIAIQKELKERLEVFKKEDKFLEAERLERRTKFDIAMIREVGYCHGIENYSRHLSGRAAGEPPDTLFSYFPEDMPDDQAGFLTVIDESHVTLPQLQGMYEGDASRKRTLIEYGFRLPSAADNRPLKFPEFEQRVGQRIYASATPGPYELKNSDQIVEQINRPTGLIDPVITIQPARGQIDDLIPRISDRIKKGERVLVTTLTKKMAEDLSAYLEEKKLKVTYLHSEVKTLDRIRILSDFRRGKFDILVGVNLLREGLDLPEVSLVAILDADKEGFLRSETALIQTIGRAARNVHGEVLLYADVMTGSIERAVRENNRRREIQIAYNTKHGITPKTIERRIQDITEGLDRKREYEAERIAKLELAPQSGKSREAILREKEAEMREASSQLDFELAAILRDEIIALKKQHKAAKKEAHPKSTSEF